MNIDDGVSSDDNSESHSGPSPGYVEALHERLEHLHRKSLGLAVEAADAAHLRKALVAANTRLAARDLADSQGVLGAAQRQSLRASDQARLSTFSQPPSFDAYTGPEKDARESSVLDDGHLAVVADTVNALAATWELRFKELTSQLAAAQRRAERVAERNQKPAAEPAPIAAAAAADSPPQPCQRCTALEGEVEQKERLIRQLRASAAESASKWETGVLSKEAAIQSVLASTSAAMATLLEERSMSSTAKPASVKVTALRDSDGTYRRNAGIGGLVTIGPPVTTRPLSPSHGGQSVAADRAVEEVLRGRLRGAAEALVSLKADHAAAVTEISRLRDALQRELALRLNADRALALHLGGHSGVDGAQHSLGTHTPSTGHCFSNRPLSRSVACQTDGLSCHGDSSFRAAAVHLSGAGAGAASRRETLEGIALSGPCESAAAADSEVAALRVQIEELTKALSASQRTVSALEQRLPDDSTRHSAPGDLEMSDVALPPAARHSAAGKEDLMALLQRQRDIIAQLRSSAANAVVATAASAAAPVQGNVPEALAPGPPQSHDDTSRDAAMAAEVTDEPSRHTAPRRVSTFSLGSRRDSYAGGLAGDSFLELVSSYAAGNEEREALKAIIADLEAQLTELRSAAANGNAASTSALQRELRASVAREWEHRRQVAVLVGKVTEVSRIALESLHHFSGLSALVLQKHAPHHLDGNGRNVAMHGDNVDDFVSELDNTIAAAAAAAARALAPIGRCPASPVGLNPRGEAFPASPAAASAASMLRKRRRLTDTASPLNVDAELEAICESESADFVCTKLRESLKAEADRRRSAEAKLATLQARVDSLTESLEQLKRKATFRMAPALNIASDKRVAAAEARSQQLQTELDAMSATAQTNQQRALAEVAELTETLKKRATEHDGKVQQLNADHAAVRSRLEKELLQIRGTLKQQASEHKDELQRQASEHQGKLQRQASEHEVALKNCQGSAAAATVAPAQIRTFTPPPPQDSILEAVTWPPVPAPATQSAVSNFPLTAPSAVPLAPTVTSRSSSPMMGYLVGTAPVSSANFFAKPSAGLFAASPAAAPLVPAVSVFPPGITDTSASGLDESNANSAGDEKQIIENRRKQLELDRQNRARQAEIKKRIADLSRAKEGKNP